MHEAGEVGLEMVVREGDVLLETCPKLCRTDDREDVTDCCLRAFSVTHFSPLVRRSDLYSMNRSFMRPLADLTLMSILRAVSTTLARSLSVTVVCDSWASVSRKDRRDVSVRVSTNVQFGIKPHSTAD